MNFEHHWSKLKLTFPSLPEDGVSGLAIKLILFFEKKIYLKSSLSEKLANELHYFITTCVAG